jgi:hypothetical protein
MIAGKLYQDLDGFKRLILGRVCLQRYVFRLVQCILENKSPGFILAVIAQEKPRTM